MDEFGDDFDEDFDQTTSFSTEQRFPEKLIRVRSEAGDRSFLVRWEGFDEDSDSWVHESLLSSRMVDEFDWGMCGVSVPQRGEDDFELQGEFETETDESENDEEYTPFVYTPLSAEDLEREVRLLNAKFQPPPLVKSESMCLVSVTENAVTESVNVQVCEKTRDLSSLVATSSPSKLRKVHRKAPNRPFTPRLPSPLLLTELERLQLHNSLAHLMWMSKVKRLNSVDFRPPKPPRPPPDPVEVSVPLSSTIPSPSSQLLGTFILDRSSVMTMENQCGFLSILLYTLFSSIDVPEPPPEHLLLRRVVCM